MLDKTAILKEAQKYLAKGAVDKAISELDRLVKDSPDGTIFNMIGDIYLRKGSQKSAIEHYLKAAFFFREEGFSQKAQALYKKVLNINPADTEALLAFGEICEEKGMTAEAIKYYLVVADIVAKEGKKDKILDVYAKILSLSPANIPLRVKVADIYIKENLKSDAAREFVHIARIHDEKGDMQKAREFFQKTLDIQPQNKDAAIGISGIYEKTGELQQAFNQMKNAVVLFPEDLDILFRCSDLAILSDDSSFGEKCLQRITEKEPKNIKARSMLGELYLKAGKTESAWAQYLPILDEILLDQKFEDAISFLNTFRSIEPIAAGKRLVSLYKQLNEDDCAVMELISMGDAYAEKGLDDNAHSCYTEAEQINPAHAEVRKRLAVSEPVSTSQEINIPEPVMETEPSSLPEISIFTEDEQISETEEPEPPAFITPSVTEAEGVEIPDENRDAELKSITIKAEKAFDEVITEADIFSRYGLLSEAQRLLEGLKQRFPENIDVHLRLKSIYADAHDKEAAVSECLILNKLHKRNGDEANAEQSMKDAFEINPEDPRLADQGFAHLIEQTSFAAPQPSEFNNSVSSKERTIDDYEEEIAEADFYARQGLTTEAVKILEKLQKLFPENKDIIERLTNMGQTSQALDAAESADGKDLHNAFVIPETDVEQVAFIGQGIFGTDEDSDMAGGIGQEEAFDLPDRQEMFDAFEKAEETVQSEEDIIAEKPVLQEHVSAPDEGVTHEEKEPQMEPPMEEELPPIGTSVPEASEPPEDTDLEVFTFSDNDLMDAHEMPEPALDSDVLDIFQEFKKGIEQELGDEDSETHYNLGIAYKEMGLVEDAIKEFQTSRSDPSRFIQSSTMLGVCYMEKGLYSLAIDVLNKALLESKERDDSYWALTYELAEAYEKNRDLKEALNLYTGVYGWSAKFRDVSDKMSQLRAQVSLISEDEKNQAKEKPKERKDRVSYL